MDFSAALVNMRHGAKVARSGWSNYWIYLGDSNTLKNGKCFFIENNFVNQAVWFAPHNDLLADDWEIVG